MLIKPNAVVRQEHTKPPLYPPPVKSESAVRMDCHNISAEAQITKKSTIELAAVKFVFRITKKKRII